ncbi:MAG: hypothetical protein BWY06_02366 [Candidatus Latescibacteria bacterium ADurb.Bin168]|nr:MAG: hypothetical protein BWY06_02366 [Candidatus Latescibacteria bacterium ADurb.Bin168]
MRTNWVHKQSFSLTTGKSPGRKRKPNSTSFPWMLRDSGRKAHVRTPCVSSEVSPATGWYCAVGCSGRPFARTTSGVAFPGPAPTDLKTRLFSRRITTPIRLFRLAQSVPKMQQGSQVCWLSRSHSASILLSFRSCSSPPPGITPLSAESMSGCTATRGLRTHSSSAYRKTSAYRSACLSGWTFQARTIRLVRSRRERSIRDGTPMHGGPTCTPGTAKRSCGMPKSYSRVNR